MSWNIIGLRQYLVNTTDDFVPICLISALPYRETVFLARTCLHVITDILASVSPTPRRRRSHPKLDDDARLLACAELAREGESVRSVARRLGISRSAAGRWIKRANA